MRLRIALPALAGGLLLGWAALAQADASPPAAPIFYCPKPPAQTAATPAPAPTKAPVVAHESHPLACPSVHRVVVVQHRRLRPHRMEMRVAIVAPPPPPARYDVAASQAFIYRYERALHGLNARAADEAWGGPPPCPGAAPEHCPYGPPEHRRVEIEHHDLAMLPPPPEREDYEDRRAPPPLVIHRQACPESCPEHQRFAEVAPPPPVVRPPACPDRCPEHQRFAEVAPPPAPERDYASRDQGHADGYAYERRETEHEGGWSYSDRDGQRRYEQWGDGARGGGCPPAPDRGCSAGGQAAYASGDRQWRDGSYGAVYRYTGRDAYGYLVWPGKTPEGGQ
jgi:hypothetical protein